jgi:hypothetical protein
MNAGLNRSACEYVQKWMRQVWKYTKVLAADVDQESLGTIPHLNETFLS